MNYRFMLTAFAMVFAVSSAANAVVIDNFNSGGGTLFVTGGNTDTDSSATDPGDALGDQRTLSIPGSEAIVGPGLIMEANSQFLPGVLEFSLRSGTTGSGLLIWNSDGVDLTDGGESTVLQINLLVIDQGQVNLNFTITDDLGMTSTVEVTDAVIGANNIFLADILGPADLTAVDMVQLEIFGSDAADLQIDQIQTTNPIPEPTSVALLGLGTLGFLRRRRIA